MGDSPGSPELPPTSKSEEAAAEGAPQEQEGPCPERSFSAFGYQFGREKGGIGNGKHSRGGRRKDLPSHPPGSIPSKESHSTPHPSWNSEKNNSTTTATTASAVQARCIGRSMSAIYEERQTADLPSSKGEELTHLQQDDIRITGGRSIGAQSHLSSSSSSSSSEDLATAAEEDTRVNIDQMPSEGPSRRSNSMEIDVTGSEKERAERLRDRSILRAEWIYESSEELKSNYMEKERTAGSSLSLAARVRRIVKVHAAEYILSLFRWGWCVLPIRWERRWVECMLSCLLAGVFLPFAVIPTAMTCAFIAGLPISSALHSCSIVSLITSLLGGAPETVSTVTEGIATALVAGVREECDGDACSMRGREYLYPAGLLSGVLQSISGWLGLGKFISLVPVSSRFGYVLAIIIINFKSQLHAFKYDSVNASGYEWIAVLFMIVEVCVIMQLWPHIAPYPLNKYIPSSAVAIAVVVITEFLCMRLLFNIKTRTVGDLSCLSEGDSSKNWPTLFYLSPSYAQPTKDMLSFKGLYKLLEIAITLLFLSSISTMITLEKVQPSSKWIYKRNRQLAALGVANTLSCFFGYLPGTTAMMTSLLATKMGVEGREGPLLSSVFMYIFSTKAYLILDVIPIAALSGSIIFTASKAVSWHAVLSILAAILPSSFYNKLPCFQPYKAKASTTDALVVAITCLLGTTFDLGVALLLGVFISLSSFAYTSFRSSSIRSYTDLSSDTKYYYLKGPLFFANLHQLHTAIDPSTAPKRSVLLLHACMATRDFSTLNGLAEIIDKHNRLGKHFLVCGADADAAALSSSAACILQTYFASSQTLTHNTRMRSTPADPPHTRQNPTQLAS